MRPGTTFSEAFHTPTSSPSPLASPDGLGPHPEWRSPVPYLFSGLAAMLGLIALALLTLACTYWRLTGYLDSAGANGETSSHHGGGSGSEGKGTASEDAGAAPPVREHVVVIMAGELKPTFLATMAQKKDIESNNCNCKDSNIYLERGIGATVGDGNQGSVELNQQQPRRQ